jgi:hypothetical protein
MLHLLLESRIGLATPLSDKKASLLVQDAMIELLGLIRDLVKTLALNSSIFDFQSSTVTNSH